MLPPEHRVLLLWLPDANVVPMTDRLAVLPRKDRFGFDLPLVPTGAVESLSLGKRHRGEDTIKTQEDNEGLPLGMAMGMMTGMTDGVVPRLRAVTVYEHGSVSIAIPLVHPSPLTHEVLANARTIRPPPRNGHCIPAPQHRRCYLELSNGRFKGRL